MFAVGARVIVTHDQGKLATVILDNGGNDYLVEYDEIDPATGRKRQLGVPGRLLRHLDAAKPPVADMVTKGGQQVNPLRVVLGSADDDDDDEAEPEKPPAPDAGAGGVGDSTT